MPSAGCLVNSLVAILVTLVVPVSSGIPREALNTIHDVAACGSDFQACVYACTEWSSQGGLSHFLDCADACAANHCTTASKEAAVAATSAAFCDRIACKVQRRRFEELSGVCRRVEALGLLEEAQRCVVTALRLGTVLSVKHDLALRALLHRMWVVSTCAEGSPYCIARGREGEWAQVQVLSVVEGQCAAGEEDELTVEWCLTRSGTPCLTECGAHLDAGSAEFREMQRLAGTCAARLGTAHPGTCRWRLMRLSVSWAGGGAESVMTVTNGCGPDADRSEEDLAKWFVQAHLGLGDGHCRAVGSGGLSTPPGCVDMAPLGRHAGWDRVGAVLGPTQLSAQLKRSLYSLASLAKRGLVHLGGGTLSPRAPNWVPPLELAAGYIMGGEADFQHWYLPQSDDVRDHEYLWGALEDTSQKQDGLHYSHSSMQDLIRKASGRLTNYYGITDEWLYEALELVFHSNKLTGLDVIIVGTQIPWYEAICLEFGARSVMTIEHRELTIEHEKTKVYTPHEFRALSPSPKFDVAISISSLEHSGLGRYGDPLDAEADVKEMRELRSLVKPHGHAMVAFPVGRDTVFWNAGRMYGRKRLQIMFQGWTLLYAVGLSAGLLDMEYMSDQPVFVLQNTDPGALSEESFLGLLLDVAR